jgi:hypothetical protein
MVVGRPLVCSCGFLQPAHFEKKNVTYSMPESLMDGIERFRTSYAPRLSKLLRQWETVVQLMATHGCIKRPDQR